VTDSGLVALGTYRDNVQEARNETYDNECCLDDLKVTRHPKRQDVMQKPSQATPEPPQGLLVANRLGPPSHPHATLKPPQCVLKATRSGDLSQLSHFVSAAQVDGDAALLKNCNRGFCSRLP
jgi:hypothetical protein